MQPNIVSLRGDGNGGRTDASCINPVRFRIVFLKSFQIIVKELKKRIAGEKGGKKRASYPIPNWASIRTGGKKVQVQMADLDSVWIWHTTSQCLQLCPADDHLN